MSTRVVKLTIINDFVRSVVSAFNTATERLQVCPNCCIGQHELLTAISTCKDTLHLPLSFELEHMPFRLISPACLSEDSPKVDKSTFYSHRYGKERFSSFENAINKWADEKGIPM